MKRLNRLLGIKRIGMVSKKAGFTLIELIVVIAIMGIATSAIFSMNLFGIKTFASGQNIAQKQFETRTAADFITKQLRYASSVTFLTSIPTPTVGAYDIYLDNGSIVFNNNGVKTTPPGLKNVSDFTLTFPTAINNVINYTVGKTVNTNYNITSQVIVLNSLSFTHLSAPIGLRYTYNTSAPTPPQYADLDTMFSNTITAIDKSSSSTGCVFTTGAITGKMYVSTSKAVKFSGGMPINGDLSIDSDQSIDISTNGGNLGNNIILNSKGPVSMHDSQFPFGNISITADSYSTNSAAITCKDFNVATTKDTVINSTINCTNFVVANSINTKIIATINCTDFNVNASTGISLGGSVNSSDNILMKSPVIRLDSALTYINMSLISTSITKNTYEAVNSIKGFPAYATSQISYLYQYITKINCVGPPSYLPVLPNNNVYNATFDSNTPQIWPTVSTADYNKLDGTTNEFFYNGPKTINYSFNDYGNLIIVCKGDLTLDSSFDRAKTSGQKTVIYCTGNVTAYGKLNGLIIAKNISGGGGFSITGLQQGVKENDDFLSLAKAFITKFTQP